jgi:hypothetical protein
MADVIRLPGAVDTPVRNKRRAGSYGRKVLSLHGRKGQLAAVRLGRFDQEPSAESKAVDQQRLIAVLRDLEALVVSGAVTNLAFATEFRGEVRAGAVGRIELDTKLAMITAFMQKMREYRK